MQQLITRYAILGAVFGVISLPIWAAMTHALSVGGAAVAGFGGGLVGGAVYGLTQGLIKAR